MTISTIPKALKRTQHMTFLAPICRFGRVGRMSAPTHIADLEVDPRFIPRNDANEVLDRKFVKLFEKFP
jgi:hypothetical protein